MPDVPVSLVPWFDAKDNPPKDDSGLKLTDQDEAYYEEAMDPEFGEPGWYFHGHPALDPERLDPQPTLWSEPSPPDMNDPLTVEDLRRVMVRAVQRIEDAERILKDKLPKDWSAIARLRRALDAIQKGDADAG